MRVVKGCAGVSLEGGSVVVCSVLVPGPVLVLVLVEAAVAPWGGVVLLLLVDVEGEAAEVPGAAAVTEGEAARWVLGGTDVVSGIVAEVVRALSVAAVVWTVGEDGMTRVRVGARLERVGVEVRSVVMVKEAVGLVDVERVVGVLVGVPEGSGDGARVLDVCREAGLGRGKGNKCRVGGPHP